MSRLSVGRIGTASNRPSGRLEAFAVLGVLLVMFVATSLRSGREELPDVALTAFVVAAWLPLWVRWRYPISTLVAVCAIEAAHVAVLTVQVSAATLVAAYQPVPLATMMAAYTVARSSPRTLGWGAGTGAATILLAVALTTRPMDLIGTDMVMFNLVVLATAAGVYVAARAERVEQVVRERRESQDRAVTDERLRIARELHDVLAHNLTLVNAQAGVAAFLISTDPAAASSALHGITEHTRRAIDDLRATVGLLRQPGERGDADDPHAPAPCLRDIDALITRFVQTGHDVRLLVSGTPRELSPGSDLAAYRIVQESLTNAAKHAPNTRVVATVAWFEDHLSIDIENDPSLGAPPRKPAGTDHGIIGMRERALAAGGALEAGTTSTGGFLVHASIPG